MLAGFSRAPSRSIFRSSKPRKSSWSSILRPPRPSASRFRSRGLADRGARAAIQQTPANWGIDWRREQFGEYGLERGVRAALATSGLAVGSQYTYRLSMGG